MKTLSNEITFNLAADADVLVKAFIAPIEHTAGNFHQSLRIGNPEFIRGRKIRPRVLGQSVFLKKHLTF